MNELEVFNFKGKEVRSLMLKSEPWFVLKDLCSVLGLSNPTMVAERLEENERTKYNLGRQGMANLVNESGMYKVIFQSKKKEAKEFTTFVTSEVLPSIRKTGGYQSELKKDPMSLLKLTYDALEQTNDRVAKVEIDVKDIKENQAITPGEYNYINQKVRNRIRLVKEMRNLELTKEQNSHLFKSLGRDLTAFTKVHTRSQIRAKDFEKAVQFIDDWEPSYTDLQIISQLAMDI